MPLEATMIILDNSEYMRNGDYAPTRFDAMADAAHIIFTTKTDSNPENSVGVMTGAGKTPEVLVTHTRELGHIVSGAHTGKSKMAGSVDVLTAINVATLALKHRQNKNLRQRIIFFVGSPLESEDGTAEIDEARLRTLAKKLKKNNIALDIIAFGDGIEEGENSLLQKLVEGVNSNDNSHYVAIPPDPRRLLSDCVVSSSVLAQDRGDRDAAMADITGGGAAGPSAEAGAFEEYGGIDPNVDPELAMVMRLSMEDERLRREQQAAAAAAQGGASASGQAAPTAGESATSVPAPAVAASTTAAASSIPSEMAEDDEDAAALQQALLYSQGKGAQDKDADVDMEDGEGDEEDFDEDAEDEEDEIAIARAIEMSMQTGQEDKDKQQKPPAPGA